MIDVLTDPEVPPLPPHISFEQARAFASSALHGDPGRRATIANAIKGRLAELTSR